MLTVILPAAGREPERARTTFGPVFVQEAKLAATERSLLFGSAVSVSGDTALVSAPDSMIGDGGSVYVFVRSGTTWTEQERLTASDAATNDYFGSAVSLSGNTAVIGAHTASLPGAMDAGAAYVFVRSGTTWTQQQKLQASDGAAFDLFGGSVSVRGDTVIIGASRADAPGVADAGAAYVFVRSGTTWTEQQKLTASNAATDDYFAAPVSVSGDTAIVGAVGVDTPAGALAGAAYLFVRSGTLWTEQQALHAPDGATFDLFGRSVSVHGDTAVVGADGRCGATGAVYVFVRSGTVWATQQTLTASDGGSADQFGYSVSLSGRRLAVGAYAADTLAGGNAGAAYVFDRFGTTWIERQKLTASDAAEEDAFGDAVSVSDDTVVVGAFGDDTPVGDEAGSAYVFRPAPADFFVLTPCRVADTRTAGPPLAANSSRTFAVAGLCQVPADARAVAAILVAVDPGDGGDLRVYPTGEPLPLVSALNFASGRTRANNAIVPLGAGGQINVQCDMPPGSSEATHFTFDVFGYFK